MYAFTKLQLKKKLTVCVRAGMRAFIKSSIHSVRFLKLLRCAHKRIVNIMKVYIEGKNIQVELIRFCKKNVGFFTLTFAKRGIQLDSRVYAWVVVTT